MWEFIRNCLIIILFCLWFYVLGKIIFSKIWNQYAPVKAVSATVVHKQRIENFSKYAGNGKRYRYAVTFSANGKELSFYVSEYSYNGYRIRESGTLRYKGSRLIDFS